MEDSSLFYNKELSWLSFNERVLQEASDKTVPLIERIHFLGIYSSNLDEFFRVRVANIRRKSLVEQAHPEEFKTNEPYWSNLLHQILAKIDILTERFREVALANFAELENYGIKLIFNDKKSKIFDEQISPEQHLWLKQFFEQKVVKHITPIIINSKTNVSACLDDDRIYFLVALINGDSEQFALVEIPRNEVKRFIIMPDHLQNGFKKILMLDDIVHYFLEDIFKGTVPFTAIDAYSIKLSRDAEFNINDELDGSLIDKMSKGLKQRLTAEPARLGYDKFMPEYMVKFLRKHLKIKGGDNLVPGVRFRHFEDFVSFPNLGDKSLEKTNIHALESQPFIRHNSVFDAISAQDILVYYPYYKFRHFTEFVRQASYDPLVKEIKINIYRVAKKSEIIHSLIEAVKNGKDVTVVVELQARFDEQANIEWAKLMKDAGIQVEFGIPSLKIHAKICLIKRLESDKLVTYSHIGTGNFHEKNARVYTDFSLFTKHKEISTEVDNIFSFIAHSYKRFRFNHLIVSPLTCRRRLNQLIENEIRFAETGKKAHIILKVNNLVDEDLIKRLYKASSAGVKIQLIVRGMCSLIPGVKTLSENIQAISIVDQFLEHPRVMVFHNDGDKAVFISSADWMERNIDHRVEVAAPIYNPVLKQRIIDVIELQLSDNCKARRINQKQSNSYVTKGKEPIRSQLAIYDYFKTQESIEAISN
ncbi:MAG: polyphosphate kinase 1 [Thalassotalea sp.]